ncbi:MAG TPA: segregation and condensation protein A, partial [Gammaproteobacteria bacterium]|nr:segregation and condensation protein A [Gammaproteobacteria bacterium]
MSEELRKEQQIMIMMRKTLASVVRDTTPAVAGLSRAISDSTVDEIRQCLAKI